MKKIHFLLLFLFFLAVAFLIPSPAFAKNAYASKKNTPLYLCYYDENGKLTRCIDKRKKMVALTYDDGPSEHTEKILSTLTKYDARATFFVIGNRVQNFADSLEQAYQMGCEIGNHTYDHKALTDLGISEIHAQIQQTNSAVEQITGKCPSLMRPPCGFNNCYTDQNIDMPLILWSVDTLDWQTQNAASTIQTVLKDVQDGDIILMHDLYSQTAAASETIIPSLIAEGYQLVTVSELAECRDTPLKNGEIYYCFGK